MDVYQAEDTDGIRMPWNVLPINRAWADRVVLPIGVHYTPAKQIADVEYLGDHPVVCIGCKTVINPFCTVDLNTKSFVCSVCGARSALPQSKLKYMAEHQALPETSPQNTTIEYQLDQQLRDRGFLFLVDRCVPADEMAEIKTAIRTAVQNLPDDTFVGLVTFDRNVFVQDLEETQFLSEFAFNGSKDYPIETIASMLNFAIPPKDAVNHFPSLKHKAVFNKLEDCRELFDRAVDKICIDKWIIGPNERPARAYGAAMKVSVAIASGWFQHVNSDSARESRLLASWEALAHTVQVSSSPRTRKSSSDPTTTFRKTRRR